MFREMRRKWQALSPEECTAVLDRGTSGVLALLGDGGYPYAVPLSYVYHRGKIYFHGAKSGHKLDSILRNNKASFCVIDKDEIVPTEYITYFRSVIVFGTVRVIESELDQFAAIEKLALKYSPKDTGEHRNVYIERDWDLLCMLEMTVDHMSGKKALELMQAK